MAKNPLVPGLSQRSEQTLVNAAKAAVTHHNDPITRRCRLRNC
jgi:hypothetical protein